MILSLPKLKLSQWALLGTLLMLQSYLVRFSVGAYPTNLQEVLIVLTAGLFVWESVRQKKLREVLGRVKEYKVLWTFAALGVLGVVVAVVGGFEAAEAKLYFVRHAKFLVFALVLVYLFVEMLRSEPERQAGLRALGYGAVAFGLFSAVYNLLGYNVAYDYRLQGPLDSAVYLAFYLTPFLLFFVMQAVKGRQKWLVEQGDLVNKGRRMVRWKWDIALAVVLLALLVATGSMGALAGAFLALVLFFWFVKRTEETKNGPNNAQRKKRKFWFVAGVTLAGLVLLVALFWLKIAPALQTNNTSLGERGEVWVTTLALLQDDPWRVVFGAGLGQFQPLYAANVEAVLGRPALDTVVLQPHNIFLLFLLQFGFFGLIFLLVCMGLLARRLRADGFGFGGQVTASCCALLFLVYFFLHGMIDTPFFKNDLLFLLILFWEMGLTMRRSRG